MKATLIQGLVFSALISVAGYTVASQSSPQRHDKRHASDNGSQSAKPNGEDVFNANCGRCHAPPMTLSPRVTGTVLMHMRTRARLSTQDEQALLKYMTH